MNKSSAVAWSFGKTNKSFYSTNRNPGPGSYNMSQITSFKNKEPNWKIGSAKRSYSVRQLVPGPGNYDIKSSFGNAPKYTLRPKTGTSLDIKNKDLPGPGAYNPSMAPKDNYAFSMRIRPQSASAQMNNPGPGTYNLRNQKDSDLLKTHSYRFGHEKKNKEPDFTYLKSPGPGTYDLKENPLTSTNSMPKFSFGKEERGNKSRPKTPGPGAYEAKKSMGNEGPKIAMSFVRPNTAFKNENPGPGTYLPNTTFTKNKSPEYRIGTSKRETVDKETRLKPGPGAYQPDKISLIRPHSPNWVFGSEERGAQMNSNKDTPGPGTYEYKKTVGEGPKVSIYINHKYSIH